ncbi:MAG: hypothetical protein ACFFA0_00885 [Promethearchaeota archaeon]
MPKTADLFKQKYCKTNYITCARYIVAQSLGKEKVPKDLFPNQVERAKNLIL